MQQQSRADKRANEVGGSQAVCIQPNVQYGKLPSTMVRSGGAGRVLFGCSLTPRREAPRSHPALWQFWQSWQSLVLGPGVNMRLEGSSQHAPHLRPRMHLLSFVRSGSSGTGYKTVCLSTHAGYYSITAIPYMCRQLTEGRFGLSHVPVLSSSPYHAIVSQRICSAVTSPIISSSPGNCSQSLAGVELSSHPLAGSEVCRHQTGHLGLCK